MRARLRSRIVVATGSLLFALAVACSTPFAAGAPTDAGSSPTPRDATVDATEADADAGQDSGAGSGIDRSWAQWPMPNSPIDIGTGAPNAETYTDNGDGTVTDSVTGLMWQQTPASADGTKFPVFGWSVDAGETSAADYCATLSLAGLSGWRLPSLIELVSLVDDTLANPSIDPTYFPDTPPGVFWSATLAASTPGKAWGASFDYGYTGYGDVNNAGWVRCVR